MDEYGACEFTRESAVPHLEKAQRAVWKDEVRQGLVRAAKRQIGPPVTGVFLAKSGAARYQVRAFSAAFAGAPLGPPQ
jgi:hypothetical protein